VITAFNVQKDKINELGCKCFADENNQTLTTFYSIDQWKDTETKRRKRVFHLKGQSIPLIMAMP
jgi:hypothetical protein